MKAATGLLAVLLMLSFPSLAQTAPVQTPDPIQQTAPNQQTAPVQEAIPNQATSPTQQAAPVQEAVPAQTAAPIQQASPVQETAPAQTAAPAQETVPTQTAAPIQQAAPVQAAVTGGESSKPDAAKLDVETQPSVTSPTPTASTTAAEPAATSADVVSAASLAPGAKLFLEPMGGFEQFLSESIVKKKVPIVFVEARTKADFVVTGGARVKKPGFITGMVLVTRGGANLSVNDAHTGNLVFTCQLNRVDQGIAPAYQYSKWADQCASRLHKAMKKK